MNNDIFVFTDEDASYCIIVGTTDKAKAEKALRETEIEWYGENHEEESIPFEDFYLATIYYGTKDKEDGCYYWGENPEKWFDDGHFETIDGFIANL